MMSTLDKEHMTSYSPFTEIELCTYLVPFQRYSQVFVKSYKLSYRTRTWGPVGVAIGISQTSLALENYSLG